MKIILLGAPGSGKGTLAKQLERKFNIAHFSTGDILRENIKNQTKLGLLAKPLIDNGQFVPDEIIIEVIKSKLKTFNKSFVLDGFPRTISQAQALAEFMKVDKVVYLNADTSILTKRLLARRTCTNKKCNAIYNLNTQKVSKCTVCGSELYQREDDTEQVIKKRFKVFEVLTKPLKEYYQKQGNLIILNAEASVDAILKEFENKVIKGN